MEAASKQHHQFSFRRATPADRETVRNFLARFFYPEETVTISYCDGSDVTQDDMEYSLALIDEGFVLLAVDGSGDRVVGISGAGITCADEAEKLRGDALEAKTRKFGEILRLLACVCESANVCQRFGVSKVYYQTYLAVDPQFRGRSLGKMLMEKQFDQARTLGLRVVVTDATGLHSSRLCERLGMQCLYSLSYNDYRNEAGQQVFNSKGPQVEIKTFAKLLE